MQFFLIQFNPSKKKVTENLQSSNQKLSKQFSSKQPFQEKQDGELLMYECNHFIEKDDNLVVQIDNYQEVNSNKKQMDYSFSMNRMQTPEFQFQICSNYQLVPLQTVPIVENNAIDPTTNLILQSINPKKNGKEETMQLSSFTGRLKIFDKQKNYGFIIMNIDNFDISAHFDDFLKAGVSKEFLKTSKQGNIIRQEFIYDQFYIYCKLNSLQLVKIIKQILSTIRTVCVTAEPCFDAAFMKNMIARQFFNDATYLINCYLLRNTLLKILKTYTTFFL